MTFSLSSYSSGTRPRLFPLIPLPLLLCAWLSAPTLAEAAPADPGDVFGLFTAHIQKQIQSDKQVFSKAHACTEWFYKQLHKKPPRAAVEHVAYQTPLQTSRLIGEPADCAARYPGGLDAAREDFNRTQASLTVSLTFYEFALVGDRNDDGRYSAAELQDVLESFGLSFQTERSPAVYLATLDAKFDTIRKAGGLETLMTSMGILYEKGYRFTSGDRAALNRVSQ